MQTPVLVVDNYKRTVWLGAKPSFVFTFFVAGLFVCQKMQNLDDGIIEVRETSVLALEEITLCVVIFPKTDCKYYFVK